MQRRLFVSVPPVIDSNPEESVATERKDHSYLATNRIYLGDARDLLRRISPQSVALSFWSPPYSVGKPYETDTTFEEWKDLVAEVIRAHYDVMKPGAFLAINIADILVFPDPTMPRFQGDQVSRKRSKVTREDILAVLAKHPHYNRYQLAAALGCSEQTIDRRLNHNNVRGGKQNPQTKVKLVGGLIEEWGEQAGFYLYDRRVWVKDPAWENSRWHSTTYRSVDEFEYVYIFWKPGITKIDRKRISREEWKEWGSRGAWNIRSVRSNDDHPAKFPLELARRVVRLFSEEGDLVLDPFVGSGTTGAAALGHNRRFIGFDKMPEYVELARRTTGLQ